MTEYVWCIDCEKLVISEHFLSGICHRWYSTFIDYAEPDFSWCVFKKGYAYCEPPLDNNEDWELWMDEPSDEEMEQMDAEGTALWLELTNSNG